MIPAVSEHGSTPGVRLAAGLGVSVLAHVLLVLAYRADHSPQGFSVTSEAEPIAVWLRPPPPVVQKANEHRRPARRASRSTASESRPRAVIAVAPGVQPEPAFTVMPVTEAEQPAHFDMDAARIAARGMADEPQLTEQGRVKERRIVAETKLARDITRADRRDCKDGIQGGLLAPLYLMMDKKDHGCKW